MIIAGERSGVGKTTITLALLAALKKRGLKIQSYKIGPDYIDPMFHHYITGLPCRNLDTVLTSNNYVEKCFHQHLIDVDGALIEGVMGLFDGINHPDSNQYNYGSTAYIAKLLKLPVLLVINCSSLSSSVAAIAYGYANLDPEVKIAGIILNRVASDRHRELLENALNSLSIPVVGVVYRQDEITIPDRHLGLVPTEELRELNQIIDRLAQIGETCFNWDLLLPLILNIQHQKQALNINHHSLNKSLNNLRIAIARDRAFNFYYQDNLDLLAAQKAELIYWSPLQETLPENVQFLYFGGGFPEVFAAELSANHQAIAAVKNAILQGTPTYAECGGLMYLCQSITNFQQQNYPMVGIFPTIAEMGNKLTLGYHQATTLIDSPFISKNNTITGHQFHRSTLTNHPNSPLYHLKSFSNVKKPVVEGWQKYRVHASYLHLHWGDRPDFLHLKNTI